MRSDELAEKGSGRINRLFTQTPRNRLQRANCRNGLDRGWKTVVREGTVRLVGASEAVAAAGCLGSANDESWISVSSVSLEATCSIETLGRLFWWVKLAETYL
jgi:hypothetical protein